MLDTHAVLDWVEPWFTTKWIRERAAEIDSGALLHTCTVPVVTLLHTLAGNRAALKALNRRRRLPPHRVVGLNRAVRFLVRLDMRGARKGVETYALRDVATA